MKELTNIRDRDIKREAFQDNAKALNLLNKADPDFFTSQEILHLARNFRGCAIYINFNDRLRAKVDPDSWTAIMAQYSWDAAIKHNQNIQRNAPVMF